MSALPAEPEPGAHDEAHEPGEAGRLETRAVDGANVEEGLTSATVDPAAGAGNSGGGDDNSRALVGQAGVALLVHCGPDRSVLILRTFFSTSDHSFGVQRFRGKADASDNGDLRATACRELREESALLFELSPDCLMRVGDGPGAFIATVAFEDACDLLQLGALFDVNAAICRKLNRGELDESCGLVLATMVQRRAGRSVGGGGSDGDSVTASGGGRIEAVEVDGRFRIPQGEQQLFEKIVHNGHLCKPPHVVLRRSQVMSGALAGVTVFTGTPLAVRRGVGAATAEGGGSYDADPDHAAQTAPPGLPAAFVSALFTDAAAGAGWAVSPLFQHGYEREYMAYYASNRERTAELRARTCVFSSASARPR
jgi:hypothetical protein